MSVEISGPKGYEYQYMVSLLVALEYLDEDDVEVYIEKENEEDAQILFTKDEIKYKVDIQAKNRNKDIGIEDFSRWISHFESNSSNIGLLNKIEDDENRFALFITNSRCKDNISPFIDNERIEYPLNCGLSNEFINNIKQSICSFYDKPKTSLENSRKNFINNYLNNIANQKLRNILKRIKINEKYTDEYTYDKISGVLNKKYNVPQSMTSKTILELNEIVKNSRGICKSITEDLLKIIVKYSGKTILNKDENYIERPEKNKCYNILEKENVLLLTGVSLCGKTYLASDIAQDYLDKGYNVEIIQELYGENGAISFINHRSIEDRLLILEDPFGQVKTKDNAVDILNEVENLLIKSNGNRKIIITSRIDIVLDAISKSCIDDCYIDGKRWIDLTCKTSEKVSHLWKRYFGVSDECNQIYDNMNKWLVKHEKTPSLQLGHIAKIYNSRRNIKELNSQEIIQVARTDSDKLANVIENRGEAASKVFIALGLSCNTYKSVNLKDLAFILSECKELPSLNNKSKKSYSFSFKENESTECFPKYNVVLNMNTDYKNELKYMKKHGYIEIDKLKRIKFIHPIYHYASKLLLKKQFEDIFDQDEVIKIAGRSLGCLSVNCNLCTLNMLEDIYNEENKEKLKKIMLKNLHTIFPSVRDKIIMFFDKKINELNEKEQCEFVDILLYGDNIKNGGVLWHEGIPWFNPSNDRGFCDYYNGDRNKNSELLLSKIDSGNEISSEEMWMLLNYSDKNKLTIKVLKKALSYDESFIREIAIRLIFKNYAFNFETINNYLDIHEHPNVIYSLFRGALDSWINYNDYSRNLILKYFKNSLDLMSVAIRSKRFLENFENEYSTDGIYWIGIKNDDKIILWNVWHEIFVELLNKFPSKYIKMNEGHMVLVTDESLKYIKSEEKVVELATAWFNWLNRYYEYNLPDDYGMSVAKYLINGTKNNYIKRKDIFKAMILINKTSFITSNEKAFIDNWNCLSNDEKTLVLDLLTSNRKDIKWIQAVALNIENIPNRVQIKILGESIDNIDISKVVDILITKNILEQCLNVHCGYPQPLWWNGYHHNNCKLWDAVIVEVLKRNELNRSFDIALREVIDLLYNYHDKRVSNIYDVYINCLLKVKEKRKLVFKKLLYVTINQNQCNKKVWDLIFEYSSDEEKEYYYDKIADDIELIQYQQITDGDILALFDKTVVFEKIYPRLKHDYSILKFLNSTRRLYKEFDNKRTSFKNYSDKEFIENIQKLNEIGIVSMNEGIEKLKKQTQTFLIQVYKDNPPRLTLTNRLVKITMKDLGIDSCELKELIKENRNRLIDIVTDRREKYNDHYDIEDWTE